ncbi:hypothetical protein ACP275_10G177100 [Erythranthe tilingii]
MLNSSVLKRELSLKIESRLPKQDLKGQSVAIIGLGKSGISAAKLALARGASVVALDQNETLRPLVNDVLNGKDGNLKTILGCFDNELLQVADQIVVSPGIPLENYDLASLLQSGKRVISELDFAAQVLPKCTKILAVTGTNGKSTVVTFAGQMLSHLNIETFVGGNLGLPLSEAALQSFESPSRKPFQVAVVEVSSYQLEIPSKNFVPSVAVILNLTPDHLERHKSMTNYATIKSRIFSHMTDGKIAILPTGNPFINEAIACHANECNFAWIGTYPGLQVDLEEKIAYFRIPTVGLVSKLRLGALTAIGTHNYYNAAIAALSVIGLDVGIDSEAIGSTIDKLKPPPHRMQIVHKDTRGVTWVDDSKATNVDATYAGLMGIKEQKSIVLLGGLAKVSEKQGCNGFEQLIEPLKYHRGVVTFGSSGTMIQDTLSSHGLSIPCLRANNLKDAVRLATNMAKIGDAIVLSPGCASFDEFKNFEHRGKFFQELALHKLG